jgi:prolyl-tRNA editing enzyme YbaK/EbsC (Cys-tRNA(Pro) deacylase)
MRSSDRPLPASAQRVQDALAAAGLPSRVIELTVAARTSQQAADALGVDVGQIAKSLIFRASQSGRAVLVIAAGDRRVDEARIAAQLGEPIGRADPAFVREHSSFAIGGVAPLAHAGSTPSGRPAARRTACFRWRLPSCCASAAASSLTCRPDSLMRMIACAVAAAPAGMRPASLAGHGHVRSARRDAALTHGGSS